MKIEWVKPISSGCIFIKHLGHRTSAAYNQPDCGIGSIYFAEKNLPLMTNLTTNLRVYSIASAKKVSHFVIFILTANSLVDNRTWHI
jgi:hypothetical protein